MRDWDVAHYGRIFNAACKNADMITIQYPDGKAIDKTMHTVLIHVGDLRANQVTTFHYVDQYIVQIARFDPSKGIFDVLDAYEKFHDKLTRERPDLTPPKLLIGGHGSVDDPDGAIIYDEVIYHIAHGIPHLRDQICVMRLRPLDQVLNALMSKATIALQLSTREGFEVKVSEAIHKGKPVIATRAGGIPLQIVHGKNGFLVDVGDSDAVAKHLFELWTDQDLYHRMSEYAMNHVYDEVSTVGNALNWLYLASKLSKGQPVQPHGRWINDLAFEEIGVPIVEGEPRLTREVQVGKMG